jgi:uncharacterized protein (TIRG00374 family)
MRGADWRPIGVAILLVVLDRALMAYRSVQLLCTIEPTTRPALPALMRIFFVSTFLGTFLPASVGGDVVRAYSLSRLNVRGSDAIASVFMDRMLGVASILIMAFVGVLLAPDRSSAWLVVLSLVAAGTACAVTMALVFSGAAASWASAAVRRLPHAFEDLGHRLVASIRQYAAHHRTLAYVLAGSVGVQVLRILQAYCLGLALGIGLPVSAYFAFIPLILLFMLLPITFNGIGTSQLAFDWFFVGAGVASATVFALSVLFIALGVVGNLPGGLLYAFDGGAIPSASSERGARASRN